MPSKGNDFAYSSFEEAVIANILNASTQSISSKTLRLGSTLIAGSGLEKAHFNEGLSIGKTLYKISLGSNADIPEERLEFLLKFFENSGFGNVVMRFLANGFEFKMDNLSSTHNFEEGIIEGFLNSLYGKYFYISESVSDSSMIIKASFDSIINKEVNNIASNKTVDSKIAKGYWLLFRNILVKSQRNNFKEYLNEEIDNIKKLRGSTRLKKLNDFANIIGIENTKVIKKNPLHMRLYYTPLDKKEFVDFSLDLFNAALEEVFNSVIFEKELSSDGRYIVDIKAGYKK